MMQVTGEQGISLEDFLVYQKALFVDMVYLQQDAFDSVDAAMPLDRQKLCMNLIHDIVHHTYNFKDKSEARDFFTRLTGAFKNFNYTGWGPA